MNENPLGQIGPFLARAGTNYAPADPILKLRDGDKKTESKLEKAVQEIFQHHLDMQKTAWEEIISGGQLVSLMCRGEHMLERRRYGVGWYIRPINETEGYRKMVMNFMGFYRHACVTKINSINPTVKVISADDDPRSIAAAQQADPVIDYWEEKIYNTRFNWREALDILNNGTRLHWVRWNPFLPGPTERKRNVAEQEQTQPGYARCFDCPYETDQPEEFKNPQSPYSPQCPSCGSNAVEVTPSVQMMLHRITVGEEVSCGAPEVVRMGLAACRWNLAKDAEESEWLIYRQKITPGDLKLLVGDAIIPDTASSDDRGLDVLERLAWAGQPFDGSGGSNLRHVDKTPTLAHFWASPQMYAHIQLDETKTVSGQVLPKGRMSDVFKGPVCFMGLNDMSLLVGIYGETHQNQVVSLQWLLDADSGAGRGLQDTAATQKRFNAADGHIFQGLAQHATPGVMIDKRLLKDDQGEYAFRPGHITELNLTQLPPGMDDIRKAMYIAQPGQVNSQYISYTQEFLKSAFQVQSFAIEFSDTFVNIDPKTATGSSLINSLANSLFGPVSGVKADARVKIAEMVVCLLAKHDRIGRYYPGTGESRGERVCGADLDGKLIFQLEAGSQQPTSPVIRQQQWTSFVQGLGGVQGLIALNKELPSVYRESARLYDVKTEAEDSGMVSTICLGRLDQMLRLFQGGVADPEILVQQISPPVSMIEPKHPEKRDWWAEFLDRDEGLEAPLPIRQAAERMFWLHENYEAQRQAPMAASQGMVHGIGVAAAQAPSALGQQFLQRNNPQPMDENTARGLLKQAGGNKNRARQLALRGR